MQPSPFKKNNPRALNAWVMYYWANSAYPLVITATLFPIYFNSATEQAFGGEEVNFLGFKFINSALYAYALSFSFLVITLLSPLLSGFADYSGLKKRFLIFFTLVGATASSVLFFFNGLNLGLGIGAFVLASIGFSGSHIFYNAYLPQIATSDQFDRLSAKGFSLGYIGSSLLLILCLALITFHEVFGLEDAAIATRTAFLLTGAWWMGFALYSFRSFPPAPHRKPINRHTFTYGFRELMAVWIELRSRISLKLFLLAFFLFSTGLQTILVVAVMFGNREIQMGDELLIVTILIIQFVAVGGAYLFAWISGKSGNIASLSIALCIWILICICAFYITTDYQFVAMAGLVGLVMGGTQAVSRSTFTKLLPDRKDHSSFFSFYEILEKMAIAIGTFSFGIIEELTGSMRNSALALALFFVAGLIVLAFITRRDNRLARKQKG